MLPRPADLDRPDLSVIDTSVPHPARVYDYFLGGTDNFPAGQLAAEAAIRAFPKTAESARSARAFLRPGRADRLPGRRPARSRADPP